MPLRPGQRLAHYEILAPIGKGGMGEVFRARDTKLGREVAIKILPASLARDPDRLARFEREAKVLASLNHPNIAAIYGLEDTGILDAGRALVMELVPGDTLKRPLALDTALAYFKQIAEALESAHEKGIVHRDLKPGNIMVTPDGVIKVLDFGLAAVPSRAEPGTDPENSPTMTMAATQVGVILGTAAYMSPEQAAGKAVDRRSDIWSFGVVFWEMLTGERLFGGGETLSHTLADVLRAPIDFDKLPAGTPVCVRELIQRCLDRDGKRRLRDIGEARVVLERAIATPESPTEVRPQPASRTTSKVPWIAAALLALIAGVALWAPWRAPAIPDGKLIRLDVDLGPDAITADYNTFAISPDGERLVYTVHGTDGKTHLATRLLSDAKPTILDGTEDAQNPFFSPDGAWIAYAADRKLRKVSTRGGTPLVICDAPSFYGGTWTGDGTLLVSLVTNSVLARVPAAGGAPEPIGKLSGSDITHRWPQALPGGEYALASASLLTTGFESAAIIAISTKTGETKRLLQGGYSAHFVGVPGSSAGHLVYLRGGSLFAVRFDPAKLEIQGDPVPVADEVEGNSLSGAGHWDLSRNGVLLHRSGRQTNQGWPVLWMDQTGQTRPLVSELQDYRNMRFSPDGSRLALSASTDGGADMFVYDLSHESMSRLTSIAKEKHLVSYPVWTADGKHIISMYPGPSGFGLARYRADGGGTPQVLLNDNVAVFPTSISPDGKRVAYARLDPVSASDIFVLPLDTTDPDHPQPGKPDVFMQTPDAETIAAFSPDGRWIAYASNKSGRYEVQVGPYLPPGSGTGGAWQVSKDGGRYPLWSPDGRSLYFVSLDGHIMTSEYDTKGDAFSPHKPRQWSPVTIWNPTNNLPYALHPDGKRFAIFPVPEPSPEEKGNAHVTILLNFGDELRRRVAVGR